MARPVRPEELYHASLPQPGELHRDYLGPAVRVGEGSRGYLVLTDRRILFIRPPRRFDRTYRPLFGVPLEQVERLSADPGRLSTVLSVNGAAFRFSHLGRAPTPDRVRAFRAGIVAARAARLGAAPTVRAPPEPRAPILPDGSPAPTIIREIVKMPCRYCRRLVPVTAERCPSCGAAIAP